MAVHQLVPVARLLATTLALASPLVAVPSAARDLLVDLPVDRVMLYRQGATVARSGRVSIPAGTHQIVVRGLPATGDPKSLRLSVGGSGVRLGALDIKTEHLGHSVLDQEHALERRVEAAGDERRALEDELASAQLQLKLLEALAGGTGTGAGHQPLNGPQLAGVFASLGTASDLARRRQRTATIRLRELDRRLGKLKAELDNLETDRDDELRVTATLEASVSTSAVVTATYYEPAAAWHWVYEARLDTTRGRVTLLRRAAVTQTSGEDWRNITLSLGGARPAADASTPQLGSLFVGLADPPSGKSLAMLSAVQLGAREVASPAPRAVAPPPPAARVIATEYAAEYALPGRLSILSDHEPRVFTVADDAFDVKLVARVVPGAERAAHLEAGFVYRGDVPIDAGRLQLYRDESYVGEADTGALLPGAAVRLPFGIDERIRVAVREEPAESGERGLLSRQYSRETRRRFEVTSYHPTPVPVELVDRLPVSRSADVHVETLKGATPPTVRDYEGRAGLLLWRVSAEPGRTTVIRQYYAVRYPGDHRLVSNEEAPGE
ncbi:MAG: mucoidy inhibitor MuiA family protein [Proteobacteria bacterium]|nr:mucoidy inhibitor MuiA family protein [Pseudomonadota bacterium]